MSKLRGGFIIMVYVTLKFLLFFSNYAYQWTLTHESLGRSVNLIPALVNLEHFTYVPRFTIHLGAKSPSTSEAGDE